jgi:stage II sporulation protein D
VTAKAKAKHGALAIVLTTNRESAVASVVAAEISGERAPEAFKALAVVVRTFMLANPGRHTGEGFDYCDTTHCQFYRGETSSSAEVASQVLAIAVAQTEGEFLSFVSRPIEGHYTSSCGGLSATPSMVWGGATSDGYSHRRIACHWCGDSRFSKWERSASATLVLNALSAATQMRLSQAAQLVAESEKPGDFVRSLVILDRGKKKPLSADEFRRAIGRKLGWNTVLSPTFVVERRGPSFIFRGRGFGSQVGLCLAGSAAQAAAGRDYREILKFYFPQTEIMGIKHHARGK